MRNVMTAMICLLCGVAATSAATQTVLRGITGSGLTSGAPGNSFSINFGSSITQDTAPYDAVQVGMIFEAGSPFTQLNIQLDSAPTVFTFLPYSGNQRQVAYTLYNPAFNSNPGVGYPTTPEFVLLPPEWHGDLADGVLAGKFWVTNLSGGANTYLMSYSSTFALRESALPEPGAAIAGVAIAAAMLRRGRRR
jgi:hypothetical protein